MKYFKVIMLLTFVMFIASCVRNDEMLDNPQLEDAMLKSAVNSKNYIVVLKSQQLISNEYQQRKMEIKGKALGLLNKHGVVDGEIIQVYGKAIQGFAVKMSPGQLKKLEDDVDVKYIEEEKIVSISKRVKPDPNPTEVIPWGITRVGGGVASNGVAWIIDTGIDLDHPDLNVDVSRSAAFLDVNSTPDDQNGHGTHVAGTIAAIDNEIGVIGVAAGATVVAVRVLDRRGSGTTTGVIAGVDYVAANASAGDVANMSLGGGISTALDDAVYAASQTGVKFALAAGNESMDAIYSSPARVNGPNIYTVSAMDNNDVFAYFSNYGSPVDYCTPGVSIYSTYKSGGYATLSGTSMASPHMAGLLLLGTIQTDGYVSGDPDGNADPIAHH